MYYRGTGEKENALVRIDFFQRICIQKLLDIDMSDHMHWTEIYPKFSKICVLTQKDHLWPSAVPVNPKKRRVFDAPRPNFICSLT